MRQLFLAIVFLTMVTLLVPGLRERAGPKVGPAWEWTWERIEGPLSPALNPFRSVRAKTQLGEIGRRLINQRNRGLPAPEPEEFTDFLIQNNVVADPNDPWGSPYVIVQEGDSLALIAPGPDRIVGTDDDVVLRLSYPPRQRPRPRFPRR